MGSGASKAVSGPSPTTFGQPREGPDFHYAELEIGSIRILELHSGPSGSPLTGHLTVAKIDDVAERKASGYAPPAYEALSYVWQQLPADKNIAASLPKLISLSQDGREDMAELSISPGLAFALTHLRRPEAQRCLWVDAICIDQQNDREKDEQIPLMATIYSAARRVVAWLGEYDRSFISVILKLGQSIKAHPAGWLIGSEHFERQDRISETLSTQLDDADVASIHRFVSLPIWERSWIIQEMALGDNVVLQMGHQELEWDDVGFLTEMLDPSYHGATDDFSLIPGVQDSYLEAKIRSRIRPLQMIRHMWREKWKYGDLKLLNLVQTMRNWKCTVAVDRVWSVSGLAMKEDVEINKAYSDPRELYRTHYGAAEGDDRFNALLDTFQGSFPELSRAQLENTFHMIDVYGRLVIGDAEKYGSLDGLNAHEQRQSSEIFPTWLPNFYSRKEAFTLIEGNSGPVQWFHGEAGIFDPSDRGRRIFCASGDSTPIRQPPGLTSMNRYLAVHGLHLDVVESVAEIFEPPSTGNIPDVIRSLQEWASLVDNLVGSWGPGIYGTKEAYDEAVRRTVIANLTTKRHYGAPVHASDDEIFRKPSSDGQGCGPVSQMALVHPGPVVRMQAGHRIFRTHAGYIGLGPRRTAPGQRVSLFYGGKTPYIIHKAGQSDEHEGFYAFIGEAYLHGVMMGEIMGGVRVIGMNFVPDGTIESLGRCMELAEKSRVFALL